MFVGVAVAALTIYALTLPTIRANRFAQLIRARQIEKAEEMLPELFADDSVYRLVMRSASEATLEPLTTAQFLSGKRAVIVPRGGDAPVITAAEFNITRTSVFPGELGCEASIGCERSEVLIPTSCGDTLVVPREFCRP